MTIRRYPCKTCKGYGVKQTIDPVLLVPTTRECGDCLGTGFDGSVDAFTDDYGYNE